MAKVTGKPARYVSDQSIRGFQKQLAAIFLIFSGLAFSLGYALGLNKQPYSLIVVGILIAALPITYRSMKRISEKLERDRLNFRKGATGEAQIGYVLDAFPDEYRVVHDLATSFGNIDHVVIGPSGVYIVDTKNWKGVVASDGSGELLLNGKPTQKPEVKNLSRAIMNVKDKIKTLSGLGPYITGILAFPSAHVDARWGTTGHVYCLRDEQLYEYIVENKRGKGLTKKEIESITQAFVAFAAMDRDFRRDSLPALVGKCQPETAQGE